MASSDFLFYSQLYSRRNDRTPCGNAGFTPSPVGFFILKMLTLNQIKKRAKYMREYPTPAEEKLLNALKKENYSKLEKQKHLQIYFQYVLYPYIVDFALLYKKLIVEVDGDFHDKDTNQLTYDTKRSEFLESLGFLVMRFRNDEILNNISDVISKIINYSPGYKTKHFYRRLLKYQNNKIYWKKIHGTFYHILKKYMYNLTVYHFYNGYKPDWLKDKFEESSPGVSLPKNL